MDWKPGDPVPTRTEGQIREAFGKRLKRARTDLGLSQAEAAVGAGCSQPVLSKLEGQGMASEDVLRALWALYDLRVSYPSAPIDPVRREDWFRGYQPKAPVVVEA